MPHSMTAFSRQTHEANWGSLQLELRSVNQRYLEPHFRLPDALRDLEPHFREAMRQRLARGKVECSLRFDPADPAEIAEVLAFSGALAKVALRLGGTVTGEHGIGLGKQGYMEAEHGSAVAIMRRVKAAFDPQAVLNPGKLIPPES